MKAERAGGVSTTLISTAARLKRQWRRDGRAEPAESVTFLAGAAAKWVTGLNAINSSAKVGRRAAPGRQRAPRASSIRATPRPDTNNSTIIDPLALAATSTQPPVTVRHRPSPQQTLGNDITCCGVTRPAHCCIQQLRLLVL